MDAPELEPAEELAEILADLGAWVEWQRLLGATALPREAAPPPAAAPVQELAARGAPERSAPRRAPPRPAPTAPAAPQQAPAERPATASQAAPPSGGKVELGERWARFAKPGGLLAGADGDSSDQEELRQALEPVLASPDPAARLRGIRELMGDCRRCGLCEARRNIAFGVGSPQARLVILGEGPGEQEDLQGEPFVGPAGQMLDRMIENVLGLSRDRVYILNMVKCRPPRNRNPQPDELDACRPFLDAQLTALQPDLVLILGSVATRALLGQGVTRARGKWTELKWRGGSARCMATFHPAYLLRRPQDKRLTFGDLKLLKQALDELSPA